MFKKYWIVEFSEVKKLHLYFILCNIEMRTNLDIGVMQMVHLLLAHLFMKEDI